MKLALAVAAMLVAAPMVALAEATVYGQVHMTLDWFDITGDPSFKGWSLNRGRIGSGNPRANRLGFKGSEDLSRGLKAISQIEFGIPLANEGDFWVSSGDPGGLKMRNTYVGLKGDFGTVLAGRYDTPFKMSTSKLDLFNDTMADYQGTLGFDDLRMDNTILYVTPNVLGFHFSVAVIPGAAGSLVQEFSAYESREADGLAEGYSLAATYANGPWYFGVAHEVMDKNFADEDDGYITDFGGFERWRIADFEKWRVGLGLRDWAGFYVSAIYEDQKSINGIEKEDDKDNDATLWQGQIGYAFGNNMVKAMYGEKDYEIDAEEFVDAKSWAVGFDHNLSQRTKAYALYTDVDMEGYDEDDWKGISLGVIHSF